jgi:hypothetical protein
MIPTVDLITEIMRLSITTSALVIPSVSLAYFIMANSEKEIPRMSRVIAVGTLAAIILLIDSIFSFMVLSFGWDSLSFSIIFLGGIFLLGICLLLYMLYTLSGFEFRRNIPELSKHSNATKNNDDEKSQNRKSVIIKKQ